MSGHYRFRRSFGNVGSLFRGARPDTYPRFTGLLDTYGGAAAAYSLRALSSGWLAGDVVEVRPSSGWTPASFTAGQIASGAMVDYVKRCGNFTNTGFETFANNGTGDGFTAINSASTGFARSASISGVASDVVTIDFDISITSGTPAIALRIGIGGASSNVEILNTSGSKSIVFTATNNYDGFAFSDGDIPSEFTVSNVRVSTNDGFVSTWYDQSGNGNDATQATTTAQPKIVDAGSLVTGGLDFDGVDDYLSSDALGTSMTGTDMPVSFFYVSQSDVTATQYVAGFGRSTNSSPIISNLFHSSGAFGYQVRDDAGRIKYDLAISSYSTLTEYLVSSQSTGTTIDFSVNGVNIINDADADVGSITLDRFTIGALERTSIASFLNGKVEEVIIYDSDQSANRVGIESNINDAYSIF